MTGELGGVLDGPMQRVALVSSTGAAFACRVLGLVVIAASLGRSVAGSMLGVVLTVASFVLTGHLVNDGHRSALTVLMAAHVSIGMFWFGSLLPLCLVTSRESGALAAQVVESFSSKATWRVPLIFLAGLLMTAVLVPDWGTFAQSYGEMLIAKTILFAVLMGLAALNKLRLGPALASGVAIAPVRFRRIVVAEFVLICGVLGITAWLTEFYSPGE